MDTSPPPLAPLEYQSVLPQYGGRRGGLIGWGVVLIVIGALAGMATLLIAFAFVMFQWQMTNKAGSPITFEWRAMLIPVLMYAGVAVAFIWTGVGSIRCKRWVRPIVLIIGWTWLLTGVLGVVQIILTGATMSEPIGLLIGLGFVAVFLILAPAAMLRFYHRITVRETLDYFDPGPAWTDRCPIQVLGVSLGMWLGALFALLGLSYNVVPFFGVILTGPSAAIVLILAACVSAYAGYTTFQLRPAGWWLTLILLCALPLAGAITMQRLGVLSMYERMGMSEFQLDAIRQQGFPSLTAMHIMSAVYLILTIGYMLWIRPHFKVPQAGTERSEGPVL